MFLKKCEKYKKAIDKTVFTCIMDTNRQNRSNPATQSYRVFMRQPVALFNKSYAVLPYNTAFLLTTIFSRE